MPDMPKVDPTSSAQNAWVQDWLSAWDGKFNNPGDTTIESTIEEIQGTYSPTTMIQENALEATTSPTPMPTVQRGDAIYQLLNVAINNFRDLEMTALAEDLVAVWNAYDQRVKANRTLNEGLNAPIPDESLSTWIFG